MTTEEPESLLEREIERIRSFVKSPELRKLNTAGRPVHKGVKPRNAATVILLDKTHGVPRILMGKRHKNLAFMPGALVFPGGRVDPADGSIPAAGELPEPLRRRLVANMRINATPRGARALAMAAVRELAEETGLLIGRRGVPFASTHKDWEMFREQDVAPALDGLRLLSRAITPPGPSRRFDTWFFIARVEDIAHQPQGGFVPCGELEDLQWIGAEEAMGADTREITRIMLVELMHRLKRDPGLDPDYPAPFYQARNQRFQKSSMA